MLSIVGATAEHAVHLADNLKQIEVEEIQASHGKTPQEAVPVTVAKSIEAYTAFEDDTMLCMTGVVVVVPDIMLGGMASPWLLSTNDMKRFPKHLLRGTKELVNKWRKEYYLLFNYVDARYEASLRWAKWAGFEVAEAEPYGPYGMPFHRIEIRSS